MTILVGLCAIAAPCFLSLAGRRFALGPWLWWGGGTLVVVFGLWGIYAGLRRFRIVIDAAGLTSDTAMLKAVVPWDCVKAVTIQQVPGRRPD